MQSLSRKLGLRLTLSKNALVPSVEIETMLQREIANRIQAEPLSGIVLGNFHLSLWFFILRNVT